MLGLGIKGDLSMKINGQYTNSRLQQVCVYE